MSSLSFSKVKSNLKAHLQNWKLIFTTLENVLIKNESFISKNTRRWEKKKNQTHLC